MEYVYAAMLLHSTKKPVNEENLKKLLTSAGVKIDEARVRLLVAALSEVNIDEAIKAGPALALASAPAGAPTAEKKKEKKEEKKEEEAVAGLGALFG